jgi:hypothetical protein
MSSKKQTAVEWLFEKLPTIDKYDPYYADIFQQAKAMEKEQIEAAYRAGYTDCSLDRFSDCEKYYTSTYE